MSSLFLRKGPVDTTEEQWLSPRYPDLTRWKYIKSISGFKTSVKIVTGEANGKLFDRTELAGVFKVGLQKNSKATVRFIFHKDANMDKARQDFKTENKHILDIKHEFPDRVHLYWVRKRPTQHYAVIDDETIIFEQPNHPGGEAFWGKIVKDSSIAITWEARFDKYIKYCSELDFG